MPFPTEIDTFGDRDVARRRLQRLLRALLAIGVFVATAIAGHAQGWLHRETARARAWAQRADRRHAGADRRDHRRHRRRGRAHDADHRRGPARRRQGPGAHRRDGGAPARQASANDPVFGAWFTLNGNGEMTGTTWLEESGILEGPIAITNTHSVGIVRDAILQWQVSRPGLQPWGLPVVAETYDGVLNDINGFHVKAEHTLSALDGATGRRGRSKATSAAAPAWSARLQGRHRHRVASRLSGSRAATRWACSSSATTARAATFASAACRSARRSPTCCRLHRARRSDSSAEHAAMHGRAHAGAAADDESGSIIVIVATDAPLLPHQLKRDRDARRRSGSGAWADRAATARATSSSRSRPRTPAQPATAGRTSRRDASERRDQRALLRDGPGDRRSDPQRDARSRDDDRRRRLRVHALPHDRVLAAMKKYGR